MALAEMIKMHSSKAFYALDGPLKAAVFFCCVPIAGSDPAHFVHPREFSRAQNSRHPRRSPPAPRRLAPGVWDNSTWTRTSSIPPPRFLDRCGIGASAALAPRSVTWAPIANVNRATRDRNPNITGPGCAGASISGGYKLILPEKEAR